MHRTTQTIPWNALLMHGTLSIVHDPLAYDLSISLTSSRYGNKII